MTSLRESSMFWGINKRTFCVVGQPVLKWVIKYSQFYWVLQWLFFGFISSDIEPALVVFSIHWLWFCRTCEFQNYYLKHCDFLWTFYLDFIWTFSSINFFLYFCLNQGLCVILFERTRDIWRPRRDHKSDEINPLVDEIQAVRKCRLYRKSFS